MAKHKGNKELKLVDCIPVTRLLKRPAFPKASTGTKTFGVQIILQGFGLNQYHNVSMPTGPGMRRTKYMS